MIGMGLKYFGDAIIAQNYPLSHFAFWAMLLAWGLGLDILFLLRGCKKITARFRAWTLPMVGAKGEHRLLSSASDTGEHAMPSPDVHQCQCPHGPQEATHPDPWLPQPMHLRLSRVPAPHRRWYAAVESTRLGHGGDQVVAQRTGLEPHTIQRGRQELAASLAEPPTDRGRAPGAGRPRAANKPPAWPRPCGRASRPQPRAIRGAPGSGGAVGGARGASDWRTGDMPPVPRPSAGC
jgi:hypothetical protein